MARPTLPTAGATGWATTMASAINAVSDTADQALTLASTAGGGAATRCPFSSFAGATDDDKLAAFMSYAAAQTYHGITLEFDEIRPYTFTKPVLTYSGFAISGPGRPMDQARSSLPIPNVIRLRTTGGWLQVPNGTVFGLYVGGLSFDGTVSSRLFEPNPSCVIWTSTLRDIGFQNGLSVLGSSSVKQPIDMVTIDGVWNLNNVQDTAFNVGGSDCFFKPSAMNFDTQPALLPATKFLANWNSLGKSDISGMYVTAESHSAFNITGSNTGMLRIHSNMIEGRHADQPCPGSLVRITGGYVSFKDNWTSYAMTNPAATGRDDAGVIHITGGNVLIDNCQYERAVGVAESVPYIYVSGGKVRVRNISTVGFTGLPVVRQLTAGLVDADNSVTVVTG